MAALHTDQDMPMLRVLQNTLLDIPSFGLHLPRVVRRDLDPR